MKKTDKRIALWLMAMGYKIVINNPDAKTFNERFDVYQNIGFGELKRVILDDDGLPVGMQG